MHEKVFRKSKLNNFASIMFMKRGSNVATAAISTSRNRDDFPVALRIYNASTVNNKNNQ